MSTASGGKRILLGTISTAHGIRGEVTLRTYTANPEDIAAYGPLSSKDGMRSFKILSLKVTPKTVIARLKGVSDRNAAEALRGVDLYVARDKLPKPDAKEFYHADLVGLSVRDVAGETVGAIVAVANFGAGDLIEVRFNGREATDYVPFTDSCVPEVDIASGYAVIVPPEMTGEEEPASAGDDD